MLKRHYHQLFALQTIGTAILLWNGVPLYREIVADPSSHEARPETLVWAFSSIALIQVGYWVCYRTDPPMPQFSNALLGHILQFLSRMIFVFTTSVFGFAFITKRAGFEISAFRAVVTLLGLFSLYCYTRQLERWGSSLAKPRKSKAAPG